MTNEKTLIMSFEAGVDIKEKDLLKFDSNGKLIKNDTNDASDVIGIAYNTVKAGKMCGVIVQGFVESADLFVEVSGAGYDGPITFGSNLVVGGKAGSTRGEGQYLCASTGYDAHPNATNVVGKSLAKVDSAATDVEATGRVLVDFIN